MSTDTTDPSREAASALAAFPVVGIGASAGGLEALQKLLARLAGDGMAFVVVQHLAAGRESALCEILARATAVPVTVIREGQTLAPNRIYVAPPDADVRIDGNRLHLEPVRAPEIPRRAIDNFFRSLALQRGRGAIGVVLSGTGSDGTLGLRSIKEEGGITFVQDPQTALQAGMPQAAMEAGVGDFCLGPEGIGDELMRVGAHPYVARGAPTRAFAEDELGDVFERLRSAFGVDFASYKRGTVERRIQRRMALQKVDSLTDYLVRVRNDAQELALLYGDLLIGVTSFFRDAAFFEGLKSTVLPRLLEDRKPDSPIRVWVAGCSTGEEAYSIAIAMLEHLGDRAGAFKLQIFATDIDEEALATARHALYPRSIELDLSPERLQRFFALEEEGYRVSRRLRDMVLFARHNLGKDPPFSRLDIVSCRNVLIYMQPPLQRRILRILHYALRQGGMLLLGLSESVGDATILFEPIDRKLKIFAKQAIDVFPSLELGFPPQAAEEPHERRPTGAIGRRFVSVQQIADRKVLERYAPPGLLVDDSLEVLQFRGHTGPFLEPLPGAATLNALKLVRADLAPTLRATLREAAETRLPASSPLVRVQYGTETRLVSIDVVPLPGESAGEPCYIIVFKEEAPIASAPSGPRDAAVAPDPHVEALERELEATKQSLQTTIEEFEASNEELQSSNEELQSSNEELQSTNEEIETSKEELQSTNEELATVNDELQSRMAQLNVMGDDLRNLLAGIGSTALLVGPDLRIRAFSAAAERLLNLLPSDVGRPVAYIRTVMMARDLEQMVAHVISTVTPREQRVRGTDGNWYAMRILPYTTSDAAIRGALLELVRAPATTRVPSAGDLGDVAIEVLAAIPQALMLLDDKMRVFWGNRAFLDALKVDGDVFGRPLEELWPGRAVEPELWTLLDEIAGGGPTFSNVVVEHPFAPDAPAMSFSARRLPPGPDRPSLTLVTMDATVQGGDAGR